MQAIQTSNLPATNTKPTRIKAMCECKTLIVSYEHGLNDEANHKAACKALLKILGWVGPSFGPLSAGYVKGDYYWVFTKTPDVIENA